MQQGDTWKSAIAEHQWDQQHQVDWDATRVLDRAARPVQLKVKEALHIEKTPANNRFNRDGGYKLLGCWTSALALIAPALHPLHLAAWARERSSHAYKSTALFAPHFTFALRMTRASS